MTLLITIIAAMITTIIWYKKSSKDDMLLGTLALMYWGASLMWFIDTIFAYAELGAEYFTPTPLEMLNDFYLGISVVVLGLVIWLVYLIIKDPKGTIRARLFRKK